MYITGLQSAVEDVMSMITTLTTTLDVIKQPSVTVLDIMSALAAGLSFLAVCDPST